MTILSSLFLMLSSLSWSQSNLKPLYFPAEQNNLQILPQRFEYTLLNEDTFKIGDTLIDTNSLIYDIKAGKEGAELTFSWPGSLIDSGEVTIKDNNGKAIFSTPIPPQQQIHRTSTEPATEEVAATTHSEIHSFSISLKDKDILETLKYLPFTVFCLNKEGVGAKIYLCSKELYLAQENGVPKIKSRSARHPKSSITVNGKEVGDQGLIYLNSRDEDVFFRARSQSGAFLEIETRKQDVTFIDFFISKSQKDIVLTGLGASPASSKRARKLEDGSWQVILPIARPFLYVTGDGNIPMRQEFYVRATIPKSQYRPFVSKSTPTKIYASSLQAQGVKPRNITLQKEEKSEDLLTLNNDQFSWTMTNLEKGVENRKSLVVSAEGEHFISSLFVTRGYRYQMDLDIFNQLSPSQMSAQLKLSAWLNLNWGVALKARPMLSSAADESQVSFYGGELLWRKHEGLNMIDPSWGFYGGFETVQGQNDSGLSLGAGLTYSYKNLLWMSWLDLRAGLSSLQIGDESSAGLNAYAKAYQNITPGLYGTYAVGIEPLTDDKGKIGMQPFITLGLSYLF